MWKYIPTLLTALLAVAQLAKDWGAHKTTWRRAAVLGLIVALGLGGTVNTYYSEKNATVRHTDDQKQITGLQKSVEAANKAQEDNTKQFLHSFKDLSAQLSTLQGQVKTAGLQDQANKLKKELEATQKALIVPKAILEAYVGELDINLEGGTKQIRVSKDSQGIISVMALVANKSTTQAKNGSVVVRVCEQCKFAEEPERFLKVVGGKDCDREMHFEVLPAKTSIMIPLKIKVPDHLSGVQLGVFPRCENCEVQAPAEGMLLATY